MLLWLTLRGEYICGDVVTSKLWNPKAILSFMYTMHHFKIGLDIESLDEMKFDVSYRDTLNSLTNKL